MHTSRPAPVTAPSAHAVTPARVVLVGQPHDLAHATQLSVIADASRYVVVASVPFTLGVSGFPEEAIRDALTRTGADTLLVTGSISRAALTRFSELAVLLGCQLVSLVPQSGGARSTPVVVWACDRCDVEPIGDHRRVDLMKRGVDLLLASTGMVVALPIIGVAALAVWLESRGNPFFGHTRIGRGGRRFRCWKLRTMHRDAERRLFDEPGLFDVYRTNDFRLPDDADPRITRVGRWLRRTSLDELPQLFNVLMGEMSLVGPRPIVAEELRHYGGRLHTLLSVRPGVTGAWAVNGRHHLAYPQRAEVELAYVRTRSLRTDAAILLRTVRAVFDAAVGRARATTDAEVNASERSPVRQAVG